MLEAALLVLLAKGGEVGHEMEVTLRSGAAPVLGV